MNSKVNLVVISLLLFFEFIYSLFLCILGFETAFFQYTPEVFLVIILIISWQFFCLYRHNGLEIKELNKKIGEQIEIEKEKQLIKILREWRHDFLNHLQIILTLFQLEKNSRQLEYLKEITDSYREIGKVLHIKDPGLSLFLLNKIQELKEKLFNLELVIETDLSDLPLSKERFKEMITFLFDLVASQCSEQGECFAVISDIFEGIKLYFNFSGEEESFDTQKCFCLRELAERYGQFDLKFEEGYISIEIILTKDLYGCALSDKQE